MYSTVLSYITVPFSVYCENVKKNYYIVSRLCVIYLA